MKTKILGLLVVGLLAGSTANAVAIENGQTTVFNFDLSSFAQSNNVDNFRFSWNSSGPCCGITSSIYGDSEWHQPDRGVEWLGS